MFDGILGFGGKVSSEFSCQKMTAEVPLSAAHEVHDLELVAVVQGGFCPPRPRHDLAIQLHCYTVAFHAKFGDERRDVRRGNTLLFPVDDELHNASL
jgi:hypothetical protein